jgi:hypothetical protein
MVTLIVYKDTANEVMDLVRELRIDGWVQGKDFDFKYVPPKYINDGFTEIVPKHTEFIFYNEKLATWFSLKCL